MKLYHYTAKHLVRNIMREGITKGIMSNFLPNGRIQMYSGYSWMTTSSRFDDQAWGLKSPRVPYDRNAVRLTLEIPDSHGAIPWLKFCKSAKCPLNESTILSLNKVGRPETWWLVPLNVPADWIVASKERANSDDAPMGMAKVIGSSFYESGLD